MQIACADDGESLRLIVLGALHHVGVGTAVVRFCHHVAPCQQSRFFLDRRGGVIDGGVGVRLTSYDPKDAFRVEFAGVPRLSFAWRSRKDLSKCANDSAARQVEHLVFRSCIGCFLQCAVVELQHGIGDGADALQSDGVTLQAVGQHVEGGGVAELHGAAEGESAAVDECVASLQGAACCQRCSCCQCASAGKCGSCLHGDGAGASVGTVDDKGTATDGSGAAIDVVAGESPVACALLHDGSGARV